MQANKQYTTHQAKNAQIAKYFIDMYFNKTVNSMSSWKKYYIKIAWSIVSKKLWNITTTTRVNPQQDQINKIIQTTICITNKPTLTRGSKMIQTTTTTHKKTQMKHFYWNPCITNKPAFNQSEGKSNYKLTENHSWNTSTQNRF